MPPRWVHSLLCITCLGSEYNFIHKKKDEFWIKLGPNHREWRHELYQVARDLDDKGYPFPRTLEIVIDLVTGICKEYMNRLRENKGLTKEEANFRANLLAQYFFHDILDFVWDEKTREEKRILEAAVQNIYLDPEEYSNLFPPWSWNTYFSSREYESQREYVASFDYEDVPEKPLKEVLSGYKSMKLLGKEK